MKKNKISKYLIFLSILTLASIFIFVVQISYNKLVGPIKKVENDSKILPIDPDFDDGILKQIYQKQEFSQLDLDKIINQSPIATSSPNPSSSGSSTSSGSLAQ